MLLASGAAIPISQLKPGDKVLATNTRTGKTTAEPVTAVLVHHDTNRYDLGVKTAHGAAVIHTTSTHLFWDPATRHWVKAGALRHGDHLRSSDGTIVTVSGGRTPKVTTGWMWDLTVPGGNDHDFYIDVVNSAVLVHNCGPADASLDNEAEAHIRARHFPGGAEVDANSGIFNADEDINALVERANSVPARLNEYGLYERVVNAGRIIGNVSESQGGLPTTFYRLWQDQYGGIMSLHPFPG